MKLLYITGHLDRAPVYRLLLDGGACMNIMPYSLFRKTRAMEKGS
jgi:hypothetical protein